MKEPNIFSFATKELSQDAFLAYMISWSDKKYKKYNYAMNKCSKELVNILTDGNIPVQEDLSVFVFNQWSTSNQRRIDLWITFESPKKNYSLIIEDKTRTKSHDSQLKDYRKQNEDFCKKNNCKPMYCYFKSEEISTKEEKWMNQYAKSWYRVSVLDKKFQSFLYRNYKKVDNVIFKQFCDENLFKIRDKDIFTKTINKISEFKTYKDEHGKGFQGVKKKTDKRVVWFGYQTKMSTFNHSNVYVSFSKISDKEISKYEESQYFYAEFEYSKDDDEPLVFYLKENFFNELCDNATKKNRKNEILLNFLTEAYDAIKKNQVV